MGSPEMVSIIAKKIAIKRQYMALCEEYGVALDDEDIQEIKDLADQDGEIHKVDFILHIKNSHLLKHFEEVDHLSSIHWKKKADLAFRIFDLDNNGYVSKKEFKWMTSNNIIDHKKVDLLFERMDLDGDGQLDYSEFTSLIFRQKDRKMADAATLHKRKLSKPRIKQHKKSSKSKG